MKEYAWFGIILGLFAAVLLVSYDDSLVGAVKDDLDRAHGRDK